MNFEKIVRLGQGEAGNIYCKIEYSAGKLSITGVEGPMRNGNARGGCGQINMDLHGEQDRIALAPTWTREMLARFFEVWDRYHLNDMQAGSPAQTAWLAEHKAEAEGHRLDHYTWACDALHAAGLNPDTSMGHDCKPNGASNFADAFHCPDCGKSKGYKYGEAWLKIEVPAEVLNFLRGLPDTDLTPAWV